jgi:AcrR family transcriptional regulator
MGSCTKPYHHGDLRRSLVVSYLELLREGKGWQFALREAARKAGVSHSAAYKHFPHKAGLLAEVAILGFEHLRCFIEERAPASTVGLDERVAAICGAYVRFGTANPNLYRLMFSADARECSNTRLRSSGMAALAALQCAIAEGQNSGWLRTCRKPDEQAQAIWSQLHGLTILILDGLLCSEADCEDAISTALHVMLEGLKRAA